MDQGIQKIVNIDPKNPLDKELKQYNNRARLLISLSVMGIVLFLGLTTILPFKDKLLSFLYPKSESSASSTSVIFLGSGVYTGTDGNYYTYSTDNIQVQLASLLGAPASQPDIRYGLSQENYKVRNLLQLHPNAPLFSYNLDSQTQGDVHTFGFCAATAAAFQVGCAVKIQVVPGSEYVAIYERAKLIEQIKAKGYINHWWTFCNEPEIGADYIRYVQTRGCATNPEQYAKIYRAYYSLLLETFGGDTTKFKMFFPGMAGNAPEPNTYRKFIPAVLAAYKKYGPMPVDAWTIHAYPGDLSCSPDTNYNTGLKTTKDIIDGFISFVNSLEGGQYLNTPVWLSEWGWTRNHQDPTGTSTIATNTPCVSRYIQDMGVYLDSKGSKLSRIFYFPQKLPFGFYNGPAGCTYTEGGTCKIDAGWPDDDYPLALVKDAARSSQYYPGKDTYVVNYAYKDWPAWSGWLSEGETVITEPGLKYSCLSHHDCSAPSGTAFFRVSINKPVDDSTPYQVYSDTSRIFAFKFSQLPTNPSDTIYVEFISRSGTRQLAQNSITYRPGVIPTDTPTSAPTPTPTPAPYDQVSPQGSLDSVSCNEFIGWARDADSPTTSTLIDFWMEKNSGSNIDLPENIYLGSAAAGLFKSDLPFADKNHAFNYLTAGIVPVYKTYNPRVYFNANKPRNVSAYAINVDSAGVRKDGRNVRLGYGTVNCPNLLTNYSFEGTTTGWYCGGAVSGSCSVDPAQKVADNYTAKVTNSGGGWGWQLSQAVQGTTPATNYCLFAYVQKQNASDWVAVAIQELVSPWRELQVDVPNQTGWQLVKKTYSYPADWGKPIQVFLRVYSNSSAWFDLVSLRPGACQ